MASKSNYKDGQPRQLITEEVRRVQAAAQAEACRKEVAISEKVRPLEFARKGSKRMTV
jgi:hypothetical protein